MSIKRRRWERVWESVSWEAGAFFFLAMFVGGNGRFPARAII